MPAVDRDQLSEGPSRDVAQVRRERRSIGGTALEWRILPGIAGRSVTATPDWAHKHFPRFHGTDTSTEPCPTTGSGPESAIDRSLGPRPSNASSGAAMPVVWKRGEGPRQALRSARDAWLRVGYSIHGAPCRAGRVHGPLHQRIKYTGSLLAGEMHGAGSTDPTDGSLMRTGFDRGRQVGAWRTFDRSGTVVKETRFE
jgi:hypothetical protein